MMQRRTLLKSATAAGVTLVAAPATFAQPATPEMEGTPMATPAASPAAETGYAPVNGLEMYYEIHGDGGDVPLVMLHGGLATIAFGAGLMTALAQDRTVIAFEQQGHGHTADIDRPISFEQMVEDTAAAIDHLGLGRVDIVGYSMGGGIGYGLASRHPDLVRKLVAISAPIATDGMRPENIEGAKSVTAELLAGTPLEAAQLAVAPHPEQWPAVVAKIAELNATFSGWDPAEIEAIAAPTLIVVGDADAVRLDHALEVLRLRGGDVNGDFVGVPPSQLAVVPGATHFSILSQVDLLTTVIEPYLAAPMPGA